jgi:cell division protease FtsH
MFVGVGASRVRDLFEQAKANAPAIVFVDEIDAVGRHRGAGIGGGHDEREQTLNQLWSRWTASTSDGGVILIAATNRPDVLDPALLRPGRFDRQIAVEAPDMKGRLQILQVHAATSRWLPTSTWRRSPDAPPASPAPTWPTCSTRPRCSPPAERAVRSPPGPRRGHRPGHRRAAEAHAGDERARTPHHRLPRGRPRPGGRGDAQPTPCTKVTILPRGRALGYTMVMPDRRQVLQTRNEILDQLAYMLGGRAAEELVFHDPTTGAANDIEKATKVARKPWSPSTA